VILITFVSHDPVLKIDREGITLLHRIDSLLKFDHRKAVVDRVPKEDAREGFGDHRGNAAPSAIIPLMEAGL